MVKSLGTILIKSRSTLKLLQYYHNKISTNPTQYQIQVLVDCYVNTICEGIDLTHILAHVKDGDLTLMKALAKGQIYRDSKGELLPIWQTFLKKEWTNLSVTDNGNLIFINQLIQCDLHIQRHITKISTKKSSNYNLVNSVTNSLKHM